MLLYVPSLCAAATEVSNSESGWFAPVFELWLLLNGKPTRLASSRVEWPKVPWIRVLSSTIWNHSTAERLAAAWISSLPVSPVRAPALPANDEEPTMRDGSGPRSGASRASVELRCCFSRTCPGCSPSTGAKRSGRSSATWPRSGGLRNGTACQRQPSAPRTSAIVSSCSLPTPTASQYGSSQNGINGKGGANERPSAGTPSLYQMAARGMLPTPLARDHKGATSENRNSPTMADLAKNGMLPTPVATDHKQSGTRGNWTKESGRNAGTTLTDATCRPGGRASSEGLRLSPLFVEWMMGLPEGWTMPHGTSESICSETELSRKLPPEPSRICKIV